MNTKRLVAFRKMTRIAYIMGTAFLLAGMVLSMVKIPAQAVPADKITWCHCEPSGGVPNP